MLEVARKRAERLPADVDFKYSSSLVLPPLLNDVSFWLVALEFEKRSWYLVSCLQIQKRTPQSTDNSFTTGGLLNWTVVHIVQLYLCYETCT